MSTQGERLRKAREAAGYRSARAAANHHGWPESTYRAHEHAGEDTTGARNYGLDDAERYGAAFNISTRWLWNGEDEGSVVKGVKPLPNAARQQPAPQISAKRLPILGHGIGGKDGRFSMNGTAVDTVICPPGLENVPGAYAIYVVGESMEPRYYAGEVVFVHPNKPFRRGSFVVVQVLNEDDKEGPPLGYIKQFITRTPSKLVLKQFNPDREVEFDSKKIVSIHRIVFSGES